jgi:hypothetical protein
VHVRIFSLFAVLVAAVVAVGGSGAGTKEVAGAKKTDVSTRSAVVHYLRSIGVNPRKAVIQRGVRNYAGPNCPGKGWRCASTKRTVVQIAGRGGSNVFRCARARCAVIQFAAAGKARRAAGKTFAAAGKKNKAACIKTTGVTQSCSITQNSTTDANEAIVFMNTGKLTGLTQTASSTASITQRATASGANTACVLQNITVDATTNVSAKKGTPVNVNLAAHQSIAVKQDSGSGGNVVQNASLSGSTASCASGDLMQTQTLTSTAIGSGPITQNENAVDTGPNVLLDIAQNQSDGFHNESSGLNKAPFTQTNTLTALAATSAYGTAAGQVNQTQSSAGGGIQATVNQFSSDKSTANATQVETQCVHAQFGTGTPTCVSGPGNAFVNQVQHGPTSVAKRSNGQARGFHLVRKGGGPSVQEGNPTNEFTVTQTSTQDADDGATQTNGVQGDCTTSGNCDANQTTDINDQQTSNSSSGKTVSATINCNGSSCIAFNGAPGTAAPPATLGPYNMNAFGPDTAADGAVVTGVNDPAGSITFSPSLTHTIVGSLWLTWSHSYAGDVYFVIPTQPITITLPAGTKAFSLYAEPQAFNVFDVQATAQDGTTSGPVQVNGNSGAKYFGFYGTGDAEIQTVTITTADTSGLAVGEFGIFVPPVIP